MNAPPNAPPTGTEVAKRAVRAELERIDEIVKFLPQEYHPRYPLDYLREHPDNANEGDLGALHESIDALGFYDTIKAWARENEDGTHYVLAGNHRLRGLLQKGATHAPVMLIDCDEQTALAILNVDNHIARLGFPNEARLLANAEEFRARFGTLKGFGLSPEDVDDLRAKLNAPSLAQLQQKYGSGDGPAGWPIIKLRVPSETLELFHDLMEWAGEAAGRHANSGAEGDADRFEFILRAAARAREMEVPQG